MGLNNHTLAFPDLVSLEAWHSKPGAEGGQSVHIDASFAEAKIGDHPESKIRFRLTLKRAEISLVSSESFAQSIIQKSVAREQSACGTLETVNVSSTGSAVRGEMALSLSAKPHANASVSAMAKSATDQASTTKLSRTISEINWAHRKDPLGNHCWGISATQSGTLTGKPWDPVSEPRLKFRSISDASDLDDPIKVKVSCRREDFNILDIEPKNTTLQESLIARAKRNRLAAAEAAIRCIIESEGLPISDLGEIYSRVCLAETLVMPEVE